MIRLLAPGRRKKYVDSGINTEKCPCPARSFVLFYNEGPTRAFRSEHEKNTGNWWNKLSDRLTVRRLTVSEWWARVVKRARGAASATSFCRGRIGDTNGSSLRRRCRLTRNRRTPGIKGRLMYPGGFNDDSACAFNRDDARPLPSQPTVPPEVNQSTERLL